MTGRKPASSAALANRTTPYRPPWSVSARLDSPSSTARSTSSSTAEAPSRNEKFEWQWSSAYEVDGMPVLQLGWTDDDRTNVRYRELQIVAPHFDRSLRLRGRGQRDSGPCRGTPPRGIGRQRALTHKGDDRHQRAIVDRSETW